MLQFPIHLLAYNSQSGVNIGQILRTAEMFQVEAKIYDKSDTLRDVIKGRTAEDFSCGAIGRLTDFLVEDIEAYLATHKGRRIATCLSPDATPLNEFIFEPHDIIMFGNEYDGLPTEMIESADAKLYIPLPEGVVTKPRSNRPIDPSRMVGVAQEGLPNLSLSMSVAIVAYEVYLQCTARLRQSALKMI
jgi:tRNA (cytidine/uridine-2'-O-)-methyltransferase